MNILLVHEIDWIKTVVFEPHHLAELFSIKGHNVFVIDCRSPDFNNMGEGFSTKVITNYKRVYDEASITLIRTPSLLVKGLNRLTNYFFCEKVIRKILIEKKIDIVLLYGVATNGVQTIKAAKELNIPVVFRVLDVAYGLVKIPVVKELAKKNEKFVIKNATMLLATTNQLVEYAIEMGATKDKVERFVLGVNFRMFKPREKDISLAKEIGIKKDDKVILFVGTVFHFAGLDSIIHEFNTIKKKVPKIKLVIVGGGEYLQTLKSLVKKEKIETDVIFVGPKPQNEVPNYISIADLCLNPFRINFVTERIIPTKILEYLACKKPVISTPLKGAQELLPDEKVGVFYATEEKFVDSIIELMNEPEKLAKMASDGYHFVKDNFDWDVLSDKLLLKLKTVSKKEYKNNF